MFLLIHAHVLQVVKKEYRQEQHALPGPDQPVDFESDQIEVDIPLDGVTLDGGWVITPLTAPVVSIANLTTHFTYYFRQD